LLLWCIIDIEPYDVFCGFSDELEHSEVYSQVGVQGLLKNEIGDLEIGDKVE